MTFVPARCVAAAAALAFLAACSVQAPAPSVGTSAGGEPITAQYVTGGGRFESGTTVAAVARVREQAGQVVLCAAWTHDSTTALIQTFVRSAAESIAVQLDGMTLVHSVAGFPKLAYANNLSGGQATCVQTGVAWDARFSAMAPTFKVAPLQARPNREFRVQFRRADLPDIAR